MDNLKVEISRDLERVTITLTGICDDESLERLEPTLNRALSQYAENVTLNLYQCDYLNEAIIERLRKLQENLTEQARTFEVYVRPMSLVAFRTKGFRQAEPPAIISEMAEKAIRQRRETRLNQWRVQKPLPGHGSPSSGPGTDMPLPIPSAPAAAHEDLIPINFIQVASLAGKDERVVRDIWKTYCRLLDEGNLEQSQEQTANSRMESDAKRVAFDLRLDWRMVKQVIQAVNVYLNEIFGDVH